MIAPVRPDLRLTCVLMATVVPDLDVAAMVAGAGGTLVAADLEGRSLSHHPTVASAAVAGRQLAAAGASVGLCAGDVALGADDLHGTPLVLAARLCALAGGGEVLAPAATVALEDLPADPLGPTELRGLPEPIPVCRLR